MSPRPQRREDRGAAAVEAAFALPILFLFIFGIIETGALLRSYSTVSNGARAGGRAAGVAGNDAMADQYILLKMKQELSGMDLGEIEYITFWKSDGPGNGPNQSLPSHPACLPPVQSAPNTSSAGNPGNVVGSCNVYHRPAAPGGAFAMADPDPDDGAPQPPEYYFGCSPGNSVNKVDCNWMPSSRYVRKVPRGVLNPQGIRPDYFGVYIRAKHGWVTGILGDTLTITDQAVYLLEPQGYEPTGTTVVN